MTKNVEVSNVKQKLALFRRHNSEDIGVLLREEAAKCLDQQKYALRFQVAVEVGDEEAGGRHVVRQWYPADQRTVGIGVSHRSHVEDRSSEASSHRAPHGLIRTG